MNFLSGADIGSHGASSAPPTTATCQTLATQPTMPSFFVADFSTACGGALAGWSTSAWTPASIAVEGSSLVMGSTDGFGMANPWVEDGVQDVDEEVHGDVPEGED